MRIIQAIQEQTPIKQQSRTEKVTSFLLGGTLQAPELYKEVLRKHGARIF